MMIKPILQNGVRFFFLPADRFKTVSIRVNLYRPLCREDASKNALLVRLLKSSTARFPSPLLLNRALDDLYGANLSAEVVRRGELCALAFEITYIKDRFTGGKNTESEAIRLLHEVISDPFCPDGRFDPVRFALEQENQKNKILNRINDKITYAVEHCTELMCDKEAYGVHPYGDLEHLAAITPESLYAYYRTVLNNCPMDVFVCGDPEPERLLACFADFHARGERRGTEIITEAAELRRFTEEMDVSQGKLTIGMRAGLGPNDPRVPAMQVCNSVFGSGAHSKLFCNVREKLSLAYYAFSRYDPFKGTILVSSGVETENFDKAYREIFVQLDAVKRGEITDAELEASVSALCNHFRSIGDTPHTTIEHAVSQALYEEYRTPEEMIALIRKVTREEICEVAAGIVPDTVYLLTAKGGKDHE